jgi:hypothetical protein
MPKSKGLKFTGEWFWDGRRNIDQDGRHSLTF